jgi:Endonuclease/Exonuclease/phosphatase family
LLCFLSCFVSSQLPPVRTPTCEHAHAQAPTLKIVHLKHEGGLRAFFDSPSADIVCLQETKLKPEDVRPALADVAGFESFWSSHKGGKGYCGVATYVRLQYAPSAAQTDECLPGAPSRPAWCRQFPQTARRDVTPR